MSRALLIALLALFGAGLALYGYHGAMRPELLAGTDWSAGAVEAVLAGWGVPVGWYAAFWIVLELGLAVVSVLAAYVVLRATVSWFRLYLAVVLILHAAAGGGVLVVVGTLFPGWEPVVVLIQGLAWFALFPLAYVFPDGRFVPSWTRWLLIPWSGLFLLLVRTTDAPPGGLLAVAMLILLSTCGGAQAYRYLRVAGVAERQQIKGVVFAVALRLAHTVVLLITPVGELIREQSPRGLATDMVISLASYAISALLPVAIAVAVVRHRLFDIDVVISRTLVYAVLTTFVIGGYALVAGGLGLLWPGEALSVVVAAALVALAVNPVRALVQRQVNRLVYGERDDPYGALSRLGSRLAQVLEPALVAPAIAETVAHTLRADHVAVVLDDQAPPVPGTESFPLSHRGHRLGELVVGRAGGLTRRDRHLLAGLAGQCGAALFAAQESLRVHQLAADLQHARQQLVVAREEERRRIRRDLHDSLGPALSSQTLLADTALTLIDDSPAAAASLLRDLKSHSQETLEQVRHLARWLRPPALDDLGLAGALAELGEQHSATGLQVDVRISALPALPAAVEVAAFRIAQESLTNVVRHADARTCRISVTWDGDTLEMTIADGGKGMQPGRRPGVGTASMRERAEELGGSLTIDRPAGGGTRVLASLPCAEGDP